jgi:hypothetical protein
MHLEIDRADIRRAHMEPTEMPSSAAPGTVVMRLEKFALTANNISYALSGDFLDYWGFFPAREGLGRLPVMGFGRVVSSAADGIAEGSRWFGFYPAADHHVVQAAPRSGGFVDVAAHREKHAPAYRQFDPADPALSPEDESYLLLLRGLFITSHLCEDFLRDNSMFGAAQVIITSASSKTSLALAHEVRRNGAARTFGLTSAANLAFVESTGLYDAVATYDTVASLERVPSVVVDMAGSAPILRAVHERFGDALSHSCRVGATHWEASGSLDGIPGPVPAFFFAPSQLVKRGKEWGRDVLYSRMDSALAVFTADARRWLRVSEGHGADALLSCYADHVSGGVDPSVGHVFSL